MRIVILVVIGLLSYFVVFLPGYFLLVPRDPDPTYEEAMTPEPMPLRWGRTPTLFLRKSRASSVSGLESQGLRRC